jgi:hypothetical protein
VVAPVDHEKVPPDGLTVAVRFAEAPTQIVAVLILMVGVAKTFTVRDAETLEHPGKE